MSDAAPQSPCIRHCCLDEQEICLGCYRNLAEILRWQAMSAAEQREVLKQCQARKESRGR